MAECFGSVVNPTMKWQIALAVGLPVAVGVGYWYLLRRNKEPIDFPKSDRERKGREVLHDSDTSSKSRQKRQQKTPLEEATILKEKGNQYFKNGKYEEAIQEYDKAIELCPKNEVLSLATFYQNKAAAYEQLKNYEEVKNACNEALALNPKYTKALQRRAKAYENTKEIPLALEDMTAVCLLENFQSQSTLIVADTLLTELVRQNVKKAMEKRIPKMPSSYLIGSYLAAFVNDPMHQFLSKTDGDFSKGFFKAVQCVKKENYDSVIAACSEEINSTDNESLYRNEAILLRGTFHQLCGNHAEAKSDFDTIINNKKLDRKLRVNALIKRACMLAQSEDSAMCFEDFQKAAEIDADNSDIYHHRGQINVLFDKLQEAAEDLELAAKLNPNYPNTAVQKCYTDFRCAVLLRDEAKIKSVLKRFEELMADNPKCSECYTLYAQVLSSREEFEKADSLFEKAFKLDPKNATILVYRAISKLKWNGDADTAVKLITEALEIDNKCSLGLETLGTIEVQRGNLKRGIELFDRAISLANTEVEMAHFYTLKNAAEAQKKVSEKLNIQLPADILVS